MLDLLDCFLLDFLTHIVLVEVEDAMVAELLLVLRGVMRRVAKKH
jgi:hypothetical protein